MTRRLVDPEKFLADVDVDALEQHDFEPLDIVVRGEAVGRLRPYFEDLEREARAVFDVARRARGRGLDVTTVVEIPFTEDLAARVEALVGPPGVAARIRELSAQQGREEVALQMAREVAAGSFKKYETRESAVDGAIRTGLAILTEGILVAPLEGVAGVKIKHNHDGSEYLDVFFAGPIRAAGGTGQALSVLIADVVRRELQIGPWKASKEEIERFKEEIPLYKQAQHLQYTPSAREIELIVSRLPVGVNGEGTEDEEVSGYRDLPRVETNRLRGGACLVVAEGLCLKAAKIGKHVDRLRIDGWEFVAELLRGTKPDAGAGAPGTAGHSPEAAAAAAEDAKFLKEIVAGRPMLAHPNRPGGFRLRYGRARTAGLASTAIHPAMMILSDDFCAVGTQLKVENPGKGTVTTPCDAIEPPIVLTTGGDVVEVSTVQAAREVRPLVRRILDIGELLVPFGEFAENNKALMPGAFCEEWWRLECTERAVEPGADDVASADAALAFSRRTGVPLHPRYNLFWHDLTSGDVATLSRFVEGSGAWADGTLTLARDPVMKEMLEYLGALHTVREGRLRIDARYGAALLACLGLGIDGGRIVRRAPAEPAAGETALALVSRLGGVTVKARAPTRIGARMGRPEKADERSMNPPVHALFPLGDAGGTQRLVRNAAKVGTVEVEVGLRVCPQCARRGLEPLCPEHRVPTVPIEPKRVCGQCGRRGREAACAACGAPMRAEPPPRVKIELDKLLDDAQRRLGESKLPEIIKGVQGLISERKIPEPLEKGILRAKHDVSMFKDGTCRYDMTDVPLTHFRPREIGTSVERLRELGYTLDMHGAPLESPEQLLELRPQDIVVNAGCLVFMFRVSRFVDELLARFYGLKPYYKCQEPGDLVGHLVVGLAPHTSGGVLARVIGVTRAQVHFAHPFFHAAKRRNCDGDEDCVMLLLDGLLNFSRLYLPDRRGGLMDAPLTLSLRIDPREIDKEAHNVDVGTGYPIELYRAAEGHRSPKEVEKLIDTVARRLGTEAQYVGFGFTHDTRDINEGPALSAYKTIGSMLEKMEAQLELARKIRAVDEADVAARVIGYHLLPDLIGNLKAFSRQSVRCGKCNSKYRRIPLKGVCVKCGNHLTMTVHEASVRKYLEMSKAAAEKYNVNAYTKQRIRLVEEAINSLFQNDKVKKATLGDFM